MGRSAIIVLCTATYIPATQTLTLIVPNPPKLTLTSPTHVHIVSNTNSDEIIIAVSDSPLSAITNVIQLYELQITQVERRSEM